MSDRLKLHELPALREASLLVTWNDDVSKIGPRITGYLSRKLAYHVFAEIEPAEFFPLAGVAVENNLVQFPETRFYWCPGVELLYLESDAPTFDWYNFLNLILEVAGSYCHVKEIYALGGIISLAAHTTPRRLMAVYNSVELRQSLAKYDLATGLDYKTPAGQRPTLNSFLLWAERKRNIPGVNLWAPIPFYLLSSGDPATVANTLEFLNRRFDLHLDLADLAEETRRQNIRIAELRQSFPQIDRSISLLESNQALSEEDNEKLVKSVDEYLAGG